MYFWTIRGYKNNNYPWTAPPTSAAWGRLSLCLLPPSLSHASIFTLQSTRYGYINKSTAHMSHGTHPPPTLPPSPPPPTSNPLTPPLAGLPMKTHPIYYSKGDIDVQKIKVKNAIFVFSVSSHVFPFIYFYNTHITIYGY